MNRPAVRETASGAGRSARHLWRQRWRQRRQPPARWRNRKQPRTTSTSGLSWASAPP